MSIMLKLSHLIFQRYRGSLQLVVLLNAILILAGCQPDSDQLPRNEARINNHNAADISNDHDRAGMVIHIAGNGDVSMTFDSPSQKILPVSLKNPGTKELTDALKKLREKYGYPTIETKINIIADDRMHSNDYQELVEVLEANNLQLYDLYDKNGKIIL